MNLIFSPKNKRVLFALLVLILVGSLFFLKNKSEYKNGPVQSTGLAYNNQTVGDLVNKDTDRDGILDWEEGLWRTDPTKVDTDNDGEPDSTEITKLKGIPASLNESISLQDEERLTETDKFSRELFTTVAALNQTGGMDQDTINKLSVALTSKIQDPRVGKIFSSKDIKVTGNDNADVQAYNNSLENLSKKYKVVFKYGYEGVSFSFGINVGQILEKYTSNGEDLSIMSELDPIIKETSLIVDEMANMIVPKKFANDHLGIINAFEALTENLSEIKLIEEDPILAFGAISNFEDFVDALQGNIDRLGLQ